MKLLITTPFLSSIGGTEIETLITAEKLANSGRFKKIEIFCPNKIDLTNFNDLAVNSKIKIVTYPYYFNNKYTQRVSDIIKRIFHLKSSFIENLFWFIKRLSGFDYIYILTFTNHKYYIPILNNFNLEKCLVKYTIVYEEDLEIDKKNYLRAIKWNIVTSERYKSFLTGILSSKNIVIQDILIANENRLLQCHSNRSYTFGLLCRYSQEKRIELAILLIKKLNSSGLDASLIIQGEGDENYFGQLKLLVEKYGLKSQISLINEKVSPAKTYLFYKNISFFLITSKFETGPLTGLEAMAAGVPVLSFEVGAMKGRVGKHTSLIVKDFDEMLDAARRLMKLNETEYRNLSDSLRNIYVSNCSNALKISSLENLFFEN